ncbi:MAG: aldehyde dehydrogenase family protein, partial [Casimicrobiaceae bacterium]
MTPDPRIGPTLAKLSLRVDADGLVRRPGAHALSGARIESVNPANGLALGSATTAAATDLDALLDDAVTAARAWRDVPAPRRGEAVRR